MPPSKSGNGHRKGQWSQSEIDRLMSRYGQCDDKQLARDLNRPVDSVRRTAKRLFEGELRVGPWSASEILRLQECYGASPIETIAMILRRTTEEVKHQLERLNSLGKDRPWSRDDRQLFKRLYGTRSDEDLVVCLGRSIESIQAKAAELHLAKDKGFSRRQNGVGATRMPRWSAKEVEILREMYPNSPNVDIADRLGRTEKSVVSKAHSLKLSKSASRLAEMGRANVQNRYHPEETDGDGKVNNQLEFEA